MKHDSDHAEEAAAHWHRWLLAGLVAGTLFFGIWGQWWYDSEQIARTWKQVADAAEGPPAPMYWVRPDGWSVVYHTLQLLIAGGSRLEGKIHWPLHVGRFLGVGMLFTAGLLTFVRFFRDEMVWLHLRMPWRKRHVVICGAGWRGVPMAKSFRDGDDRVVVIEKDPAVPGLRQCRQHGIVAIVGDATDPALLRSLRAHDARMLVAVCSEDGINMEIALAARRLAEKHRTLTEPLHCYVHMSNIDLLTTSRQQSILVSGGKCVFQTGGIDLYEESARWLFRRYPLDYEPAAIYGRKRVHLVVVGFNQSGEAVILHAARIGHFARHEKMRITVIDPKARAAEAEFRFRYPQIDSICAIDFQEADLWDPATVALAASICSPTGGLPDAGDCDSSVTFVVCLEDDSANLSVGFKLFKHLEAPCRIRVRMFSHHTGLGVLLSDGDHQQRFGEKLSAFGMLEDICNAETLEREELDALARVFHQLYCEEESAKPQASGGVSPNPSVADWNHLAEDLKNSNRYAADHLETKLRAAGYRLVDATADHSLPIELFNQEQIETLARMEHHRYCADRFLAGWTYREGKKDNIAKTNPTLVAWEQLEDEEKDKDRRQVRQIRGLLFRAGKAVAPLED